jgi:hypothetical protein
MMMGPDPMISTDFIEVSLGIFWAVQNCANVRQEGEILDNRFQMGIFGGTLTKSTKSAKRESASN